MLTNYEKKLASISMKLKKKQLCLLITHLLFCRASHDESYRVTLQIRKLKNAMEEHAEINLVKDNPDGSCEFIIPKKWCKVSFPRVISEEERLARASRLRKNLGM